jgi:hypothetical protein
MNRAWSYVISKELNEEQLSELQNAGNAFVKGWTAHEQQLSGSFEIFKKRIIVIRVNEDIHAASGCSIDKLTRFIKQLESEFNIELMNRLLVAYRENDHVNVIHSSRIKEQLQTGTLNENSIIYNTALANQDELAKWEQPLKNTWLNKYL